MALAIGWVACDEPEAELPGPVSEVAEARLSDGTLSRCETIDDDGVCELVAWPGASSNAVHDLDLWLPGDTTEAQWVLRGSGEPVGASSERRAGGTHHRIAVPVPSERAGSRDVLELSHGGEVRWQGEIRWSAGSAVVAAFRAKSGASGFSAKEHGEFADRIEQALEELDPAEQVAALELIRKRRARQADGSSVRQLELVRPVLDRLIPLAAEQGRWSALCSAASVDIYVGYQSFTKTPSPVRHEQWRTTCNERAPQAMFDYYSGVSALRRGEYRRAEERLRAAIAVAEQTADAHLLPAQRRLAEVMAWSGRWGEMERLMAAMPDDANDCDAFGRWSDEGFYRLLAAEYGGLDLGDPSAVLHRAETSKCSKIKPVERAHLQIKQAQVAINNGDYDRARTRLAAVDPKTIATTKYETQRQQLLAELALAQGRYDEALEHVQAADATAAEQIPEQRWAVQVLLARIEHARGRTDEAEAAYRAAEAQLDRLAAGSAAGLLDRIAFMHRAAVDGLAALLVEQGRVQEALCALRHANRRPMVRHAFGSSPPPLGTRCEQGAALVPGEQWLAFTPIDDELWALTLDADGQTSATSTGVRLPLALADSSEATAAVDALVQAAAPSLAGATRVRILPTPTVLELDLHRGRIDGEPLIARVPVSYSLDLPATPAPADDASPRSLLAFADVDRLRRLDLWADHITEIDQSLHRAGWTVARAETPEQLGPNALESSLAGLDLFYYFGHGAQISAVAGEGAHRVARIEGPRRALATTALDLGDGGFLGPHEVLELASVPRHVLLVGCELANPDLLSSTGGLNLVQASLLAGAVDVVAAPTDIGSGVGANFGPRMVQSMAEHGLDAAVALHSIWRESRDQGRSEPPWYEFRVWSR